jgi:XTP/dITP diphosphohydrolase
MSSSILFASNNEGKIKEAKAILHPYRIDIITPKDAGIDLDVIEDGDTYMANAIKKAEAFFIETMIPTIADDSGLEILALNNEPGIFTHRYFGEKLSFEVKRQKMLNKMKKIADDNRGASYNCIVAYCDWDTIITAEGKIEGTITREEAGNNGFGYDHIFKPNGYEKTFAELDVNTKNQISHRAIALSELAKKLTQHGFIH